MLRAVAASSKQLARTEKKTFLRLASAVQMILPAMAVLPGCCDCGQEDMLTVPDPPPSPFTPEGGGNKLAGCGLELYHPLTTL